MQDTVRPPRDHGGGLDAAIARWGGARADWIDLSTGINPVPWPVPDIPPDTWAALPDAAAARRLVDAARTLWSVPCGAAVLAVPGCSAAIAAIPRLISPGRVSIPGPTYNEHAAAFAAADWIEGADDARVLVHPNNPDGRLQPNPPPGRLTVIDESFCDVMPEASLICRAADSGVLVLKSFGKFWGLAGLRLGFVIGDPVLVVELAERLGPWPVSGPALTIGAAALVDRAWQDAARTRLAADAARLDRLMARQGEVVGGTTLFRLYDTPSAEALRDRLAEAGILARIFPYSDRWIRLGLPPPDAWDRLEAALG